MLYCYSATGILVQPPTSLCSLQYTCSQCFNLARGVTQGGILSPYSFKLYVRDLLKVVVKSCIGFNIAGWFINILAYADDMVLLAPPWKGLQCLLDISVKNLTVYNIL